MSAISWGVHGCISCRAAPRDGRSLLCRPCRDKALRKAPVIMEVPGDHESYTSGVWLMFLAVYEGR